MTLYIDIYKCINIKEKGVKNYDLEFYSGSAAGNEMAKWADR